MKSCLLVSFDLLRPGEPSMSLSIASLVAFAKSATGYGTEFDVDAMSFNMAVEVNLTPDDVVDAIIVRLRYKRFASIALACYVWSEYLINPIIARLRLEGFRGRIILGGYQIEYSHSLSSEYPGADVFIKGYGEASLVDAIGLPDDCGVVVLDHEPPFAQLPSPYLDGTIQLSGVARVRTETKRGCPYRCTFCAHRDLQRHKVYRHPREKSLEEMRRFADAGVEKVNVLDPVFNAGADYVWLLEQLVGISPRYLMALQTRFENIRGPVGERFLDLCSKLTVHLEFGLQSAIPAEFNAVNRRNDVEQVSRILVELNTRGISYEVSLIYGLPNQTPTSFLASIDFLVRHGCQNIRAYPLMLLRGTELSLQKDAWGFREEVIGPHHIPVVVESKSFSRRDWLAMREIGEALGPVERF